jgi:hypothetical protein
VSTGRGRLTHDYGPGRRQRGVDYSIYNLDRTSEGLRLYVSGHARAGDASIRLGDEVVISPPGSSRGRTCRVADVIYSGAPWDAVLDMLAPSGRPHDPGARPVPLSRLLHP